MVTELQRLPGDWNITDPSWPIVLLSKGVYTSDAFSGGGSPVSSRSTDTWFGGSSKAYTGDNRTLYEVSTGNLRYNSANTTSGSSALVVQMPMSDYEIAVTLSALVVGNGMTINARRENTGASATTGGYRVTINATGGVSMWSRPPGGGTDVNLATGHTYSAGDTVGIRCIGTSISLVKNGIVLATAINNVHTLGGYSGISTSRTSPTVDAIAVDAIVWTDFS